MENMPAVDLIRREDAYNRLGSVGADIATGFRDCYTATHAEYRRRTKAQSRAFNLGDAWPWRATACPGCSAS
jgi:hypothetical protein